MVRGDRRFVRQYRGGRTPSSNAPASGFPKKDPGSIMQPGPREIGRKRPLPHLPQPQPSRSAEPLTVVIDERELNHCSLRASGGQTGATAVGTTTHARRGGQSLAPTDSFSPSPRPIYLWHAPQTARSMHRIYVIHENPAWLPPLSEAFDQRRSALGSMGPVGRASSTSPPHLPRACSTTA